MVEQNKHQIWNIWAKRRQAVFALAGALVLVLGVFVWAQRSETKTTISATGPNGPIIPIEQFSSWEYEVTDQLARSSREPLVIPAAQLQNDQSTSGRTIWPTHLIDPWSELSDCEEVDVLELPSQELLGAEGETHQLIRAICGGSDLTGAARLSWTSKETVVVPAGSFRAHRIDVAITGFQDPFPLTLSLWIDPATGVIQIEVRGGLSDADRHFVAELAVLER